MVNRKYFYILKDSYISINSIAMKSVLTFLILLSALSSFGQKKMIASTHKIFQLDSSLTTFDSIAYSYADWQGSIESFKPRISFDNKELIQPNFNLWTSPNNAIPCHHEESYNMITFQLIGTTNNTIEYDRILESNSDNSILKKYEYDNAGNLTRYYRSAWISNNWETIDSTLFFYDNMGNRIRTVDYSFDSGSAQLFAIDSVLFIPSTNLLLENVSYQYEDTSVYIYKSIVDNSGSQANHLDFFYYDFLQSDFVWVSRRTYEYTGTNLTGSKFYFVNNNIQDSIENGMDKFYYDSQNKLVSTSIHFDGEIQDSVLYEYETPDFISKSTQYIRHLDGISFYRAIVNEFFYQNTLKIDDINKVEVLVYPNPTADFISIQTKANIYKISLTNSQGKTVIEQTGKDKLDVRSLPSGIYKMTVITSQGIFNCEIVKL